MIVHACPFFIVLVHYLVPYVFDFDIQSRWTTGTDYGWSRYPDVRVYLLNILFSEFLIRKRSGGHLNIMFHVYGYYYVLSAPGPPARQHSEAPVHRAVLLLARRKDDAILTTPATSSNKRSTATAPSESHPAATLSATPSTNCRPPNQGPFPSPCPCSASLHASPEGGVASRE
jgi:hypothetical protein